MKLFRVLLLALILAAAVQTAHAQNDAPLALVITVDAPIMPSTEGYVKRGLKTAELRHADLIILQLNTPGGYGESMLNIVEAIQASDIPVIVYVTPSGGMAGSAGAIITMAGHAAAMAPQTIIGAASPIGEGGAELGDTAKRKAMEAITAEVRALTKNRPPKASQLAQDMIEKATAVTAEEALEVGLIDFIAKDLNDLLRQLDGFKVIVNHDSLVLNTANAVTNDVPMSFIEILLGILTDSNIAFLLLAIGVQAILIEISSPGGWAAGFIGVVCLSLAIYGMGVLPVNWFGIIFLVTAFVLFILDIKAPTHGALTTAGVASFIVGALVLFNSPGTPQFQRVSVPLVVGVGIFLGMLFFGILIFALRAQRAPVRMGVQSFVGKTGSAKTDIELTGQVQVGSELWSAEPDQESESIRKGDQVEVVKVEGLRLIVKKK